MAKTKTVSTDAPVIKYEADPETFKTIVLKVHKKIESDPYVNGCAPSAGERDAQLMSQEFPNEPFITVHQNGIPLTMSVNELVRDVLLTVFNKALLEDLSLIHI